MRAGLEVVHLLELVLVIVEDVRHCGSYAKEGRLPVSTACLEKDTVTFGGQVSRDSRLQLVSATSATQHRGTCHTHLCGTMQHWPHCQGIGH